jgi:hypothetical protein
MKKVAMIFVDLLVFVAVFGVAGFAYAQTQTPTDENAPSAAGPGWGMMGRAGQGMMGRAGQGMMGGSGYGPMHEYMEEALAAKLGLTEEEIEEKLAAGETMWSIAQAQGLTDEEIGDLMLGARDEALKAAVAAGVMTQEQADWMAQHMQQMRSYGTGAGGCGGGFGQGARQRMPMGRWFNQP